MSRVVLETTWKTEKLSDLPIQFIDGDRSSKYPKRGEFQDKGVLFLNSTNINGNRFDFSEANFITKEKFDQIKKGRCQHLDIVMTTRGSVGKVALFHNIPYTEALVNAQMLIIRADGCEIDQKFLYYILSSNEFQGNLKNFSSGSAQPQIPIRDLREIHIAYPPLETQRKIASILSAYDDLIENNARRIKVLEEMAQAIYREWFVNFRFPGHEKVGMVDSPLGRVPEGWEVVKLGHIAEVNARSIRKGSAPETINYIDISSVSTGSVDKVEELAFADAPSRARRIVKHGDVVWATVRPNRKSYSLIVKPIDDLVVSTGFAVLSPMQTPFTYLYLATTTEEFAAYLVSNATGSAYPAVNSGNFKNADMLLPSREILDRFHESTEGLFLLKYNLDLKNRNLRQTRDLLLPKLISGEVDVSELDIDIKGAA